MPTEEEIENGEETFAPRPNFDQFDMAFTAIFIVFIGEDWQSVMHNHYRVVGNIALVFFPVLYIMLNLILLNLFLAVLLGSFEAPDDGKGGTEATEDKTLSRVIRKLKNACKRCCCHR